MNRLKLTFLEKIKKCCRTFASVNAAEKFQLSGVVPDILCKAPSETLLVNYPKCSAELGNELNPIDVKNPPNVKWSAEHAMLYTIVMVDPDQPCRTSPTDSLFLHWLVVNIPLGDVKKGLNIVQYVGAIPTRNTGLHRIVLLLYKQRCEMSFCENIIGDQTIVGRTKWCLRSFEKKYRLCEPQAGNFFFSQWDCYVESLCQQIGMK